MRKKSFLLKVFTTSCLVAGLMSISLAVYARNINRRRHPNLAAAQSYIEKAIDKVSAAQIANEFDMGGHAAKAKRLLSQAYDEIKLAARAANR